MALIDLSNLKKLLGQQAGGAAATTGKTALLVAAKAAVPLLLAGAILGGIATMDQWLVSHPEERQALLAQSKARFEGLEQAMRKNPWASLEADPASFVMRFFLGSRPELRARLDAILAGLSRDQLLFLARVLQTLELQPAQLQALVARMEALLQREGAEKIIPVVVQLGKEIMERAPEATAAKVAAALTVQASTPAAGQPGVPEAAVAQTTGPSAADLAALFGKVMTETDLENLDAMLAAIAELPPDLSKKVTGIIGQLAARDAEKLIAIVNKLSNSEIKPVVDNLARLPQEPVSILLDRFERASTSNVVTASRVFVEIPAPTVTRIVVASKDIPDNSFFFMVGMIAAFPKQTVEKFADVTEKLGSKSLVEALGILSSVSQGTQAKAVEIMGDVKAASAEKLVDVAKRIASSRLVETGVKVLDELNATSVQEKAIGVLDNVRSQALLASSVELLDNVSTKAARQTVTLAYELNDREQEKAMNLLTRLWDRDSKDKWGRVEDIAQRFTDIGSTSTLATAVNKVEEMSDQSLNQAVSVMLRVDEKRTVKAVNTFGRLDLDMRESSVDTLDKMKTAHVQNAVDITQASDDDMLTKAVSYSERLKVRLGEAQGIETVERAVNVASRVDDKARQQGLDALTGERDVTARRVLRQVDGQEAYTAKHVTVMTDLYAGMDRANKGKFADVLSGSEGLVLGPAKRGGLPRTVEQDRKIMRTAQYLDQKESDPAKHVAHIDFVKQRSVIVPHDKEQTFEVKTPVPVVGVRGKPARTEFNLD